MNNYHTKYPQGTDPVKLTYDQSTEYRLMLIKKRAVNRNEQLKITPNNDSNNNCLGCGEPAPEPNRLQSTPCVILGRSAGQRVHTVGSTIDIEA